METRANNISIPQKACGYHARLVVGRVDNDYLGPLPSLRGEGADTQDLGRSEPGTGIRCNRPSRHPKTPELLRSIRRVCVRAEPTFGVIFFLGRWCWRKPVARPQPFRFSQRSIACLHSSNEGTSATRKKPSPPGPNEEPGATIIPSSRSLRA